MSRQPEDLHHARPGRPYPTPHLFCLTLTCPSEPGQVAAVVGFLDRRGGYVDELAVFDDKSKQRFFLRCIFHAWRRSRWNWMP